MDTKSAHSTPPRRIIRLPEVMHKTGLSRSTLYRWIAQGRFPAQIAISGRMAGWDSLAVDQWIEEQINAL